MGTLSKGKDLFPVLKFRKTKGTHPMGYGSSLIGDRPTQEDFILLPNRSISRELLARRGFLGVLCDGMGGLSGGETASRVCAETLMHAYYKDGEMEPCQFYRSILPEADRVLAGLTHDSGAPLNAGTTVSSVIIQERRLYWASVGDSRIYLFQQGKLRRLSKDHNYGLYLSQDYLAGKISELDLLLNEQSHVLVSYIGMGGLKEMDTAMEEGLLETGDVVLLCSDGLHHALRDDEIETALRAYGGPLIELPGFLTHMASQRDWILHDNISVVVLGIQ